MCPGETHTRWHPSCSNHIFALDWAPTIIIHTLGNLEHMYELVRIDTFMSTLHEHNA